MELRITKDMSEAGVKELLRLQELGASSGVIADSIYYEMACKAPQPDSKTVDLFEPSLEAAEKVFGLIKPENEFRSMCRHTAAKEVEIIFKRHLAATGHLKCSPQEE